MRRTGRKNKKKADAGKLIAGVLVGGLVGPAAG